MRLTAILGIRRRLIVTPPPSAEEFTLRRRSDEDRYPRLGFNLNQRRLTGRDETRVTRWMGPWGAETVVLWHEPRSLATSKLPFCRNLCAEYRSIDFALNKSRKSVDYD